MPSRQTVEAFVAQVLSGDHVGAIRDWYLEDAFMQENLGPRREGRALLMEQEAATLSRMERVETELLDRPLIEGDKVAIRWRFTFTRPGGRTGSLEEVAWQTWRGDRIAEEVFFYDPGQMAG